MPNHRKQDPIKYCHYCNCPMTRKRINGRLEDLTVFSKRKYCSRKCMASSMEKDICISAKHSRVKANRTILDFCENCGTNNARLHVHHMDMNPRNNTKSNLKTLCVKCHALYHSPNNDSTTGQRLPCLFCSKPSYKNRMCNTHISRLNRFGHPLAKKRKVGSSWILMYEHGGKWYSIPSEINLPIKPEG